MPLLDHFHPPLSANRHWESFHARWATAMADALNGQLLPSRYFAEAQVHVGSRVEVDVGTFEEHAPVPSFADRGGGTATLVLPAAAPAYAPPAPEWVMRALFPDVVEVLVFATDAGPTLVAAVELVSPGNKDRPEARRAFAAKCAAYLQQGIGLVVVDVVTNREANLHNDLVILLGAGEAFLLPPAGLYAVAYRPRRLRDNAPSPTDRIEGWPASLAVGLSLPRLPLALDKGQLVPLDLEASYTEARQRSRLG